MIAGKIDFLTFWTIKRLLVSYVSFFFYFKPILLSQYLAKDTDLNNSEFALSDHEDACILISQNVAL